VKCITFRAKLAPVSTIGLGYRYSFGFTVILCIILISILTPDNIYLIQRTFIKVILLLEDKNSM